MQPVNLSFSQDPNTLMLALMYGMVPAILWLIFWLHEKSKHSKRGMLYTKIFIAGALAVIAVLPIQQFIATLPLGDTGLTILWAASEEILKFSVFAIFILASRNFFDPVDYPLSLMVIALAFAGFENALYFLAPLQGGDVVVSALAGTTRYLGTTLLHTLASSLSGFALAFAYFQTKKVKILYCTIGLAVGITLHSMFNILISQSGEQESFKLFSFLWLLAIVLMILYEIVRQMGSLEYRNRKKNKALARINTIFNALCQKENILKDDERSISEIFSNKGIKKGSSSDNDLNLLIGHLREMYVGYLGTQGVPEKKAHETATGIISDKASSKAIGGIINVLGAANVIPNDRDFASD